MKRIGFRPAAVLDVAEAALWYENERPTLGWAFDQEVQRLFTRLQTTPQQFPEVADGVRRAMLDRFPYAIYFHRDLTVQDADVVAAALIHFRKKPNLGFSDCLVLEIARKAGHVPLGTFDGKLGKLNGAERL
jgi:predicted nucleic acid-binding protein